jgi:glycosyltransferase involved in cell wall biosynthesis
MWRNRKVSVIFPTHSERDCIRSVILDFHASGFADEIIVVNNNAEVGTSEEVAGTPAREVFESKPGYGNAIQKGLREAAGDLLIISEPDSTFSGHDVIKLLAYSDDFDVVFGTRTSPLLIWRGANMGFLMRWGNILAAKVLEFLFNTSQLTDMGCTMRLLSRSAYERMKNDFTVGGSHFSPEVICLTAIHGLKSIEIPVNYRPRVGESTITGSKIKAVLLGIIMLGLVLKYRLKSWFPFGHRRRVHATTIRQ